MSESPDPTARSASPRPHVVIVGLMGVGKTTTGSALATALGLAHVDSDVDIEKLIGGSGADFAAHHGVPLLHELEAAVLLGGLMSDEPSVISAASSTVESPLVRLALPRRAEVVRLKLAPASTIARQATGAHRRPMTPKELAELTERREPFFNALADLTLDAERPTDDLVASIVDHLGDPCPPRGLTPGT